MYDRTNLVFIGAKNHCRGNVQKKISTMVELGCKKTSLVNIIVTEMNALFELKIEDEAILNS